MWTNPNDLNSGIGKRWKENAGSFLLVQTMIPNVHPALHSGGSSSSMALEQVPGGQNAML